MKSIYLFCVLTYVNNVNSLKSFYRGHTLGYDIPPPSEGLTAKSDSVTINYFKQKLNHYDPTNTDTWLQRYYVNTEYFSATTGYAAFLLISGEGEASLRWITSGAWIETAKIQGALLFQLEHRFYGASQPFSNLSIENLRYLSSQQALGDISTFITGMKEQYNLSSDVKWILFGGSYAGSLAAWARLKYPHLVQGAMSASGPLFGQLDFPEYLQVVADDLATYSQQCLDVVQVAENQLEELLSNPGNENVTALFNLCDPIEESVNNTSDMGNLFMNIADNFAGVAQYNKNAGRTTSIDDLCEILTNETIGREVYRLAEVTKLLTRSDCFDYKYENSINSLKNVTYTVQTNMRQWIYQTCTEYGWYQTSSQETQVFGNRFPLDFFTKICTDVYGEEFNETFINEQINRTNIYYGGYNIEVTNVVFVHGSVDPWNPMGLTETRHSDAPVIFINGTAHCSNMYNISDSDIPELTAARKDINNLIAVWLLAVSEGNGLLPSYFLLMLFPALLALSLSHI